MKTTLTVNQIADHLRNDTNAAWTYEGARALAEFLDDLDADTGEDTELDVVAIRCEFSEYGSASEAAQDHGWEGDAAFGTEDDPDDAEAAALSWLHDRTFVVEFSGGVIVSQF